MNILFLFVVGKTLVLCGAFSSSLFEPHHFSKKSQLLEPSQRLKYQGTETNKATNAKRVCDLLDGVISSTQGTGGYKAQPPPSNKTR